MDRDIVSTSGQHPEKFIRELHSLANCVKSLYSSLYPSIILENNLAPNTQIGRLIIEDKDNPERMFSLNEHQDMYSSEDETARYSRGGEFLENYMSGNPLEFARRWLGLGDVFQVLEDIREFYKFNGYTGRGIDYDNKEAVYFVKPGGSEALVFEENYMGAPAVTFQNRLDVKTKEDLEEEIRKGALL